jgi:hypothetical protein
MRKVYLVRHPSLASTNLNEIPTNLNERQKMRVFDFFEATEGWLYWNLGRMERIAGWHLDPEPTLHLLASDEERDFIACIEGSRWDVRSERNAIYLDETYFLRTVAQSHASPYRWTPPQHLQNTILHEFAHLVDFDRSGRTSTSHEEDHSPEWRNLYYRLRHEFGLRVRYIFAARSPIFKREPKGHSQPAPRQVLTNPQQLFHAG